MTLIVDAELDLKKLGLTHAKGRNDKCDGNHSAEIEIPEPFDVDLMEKAIQLLHEAAHPGGALSFRYCFESGCADATAAFDFRDGP